MADKPTLGTFRNYQDTDNIIVHDILPTVIDGVNEIYITITYQDREENLLLQDYGFIGEEIPYNTDEIRTVPYFIIDNDVYYLEDIYEVGSDF